MSEVRVDQHGHVAWLTLSQLPRRNAINRHMWRQLTEVAGSLRAASDVRCVVLRGAGEEAFVSGADISELEQLRLSPSHQRAFEAETDAAFSALRALEVPVLCAIHGWCVGGGVAIALCADLRYAADDARFALPPGRLGVGYGLANLENALRCLPPASVAELFYTARTFDAAEALGLGLVSRVYPKAELDQAVEETARRVADNAPLTLRAVKAGLSALQRRDTAELVRAQGLVDACFESEDFAEGLAAFLEKRPPRFQGR